MTAALLIAGSAGLLWYALRPASSGPVVVLQPRGSFSAAASRELHAQIREVYGKTLLRPPVPLPPAAYYPLRNRYRADSIIAVLARSIAGDTVVIGLTDVDISTTKEGHADWGVMGLAYRPGRACIVSAARLSKARRRTQFYKVAVHELGHTQGLRHCPPQRCFMRDAEGGNPLNEEQDFCPTCKRKLGRRGWTL